jgi:amidophosphoribosyltransferase
MQTTKEFIAGKKKIKDIGKMIGADSLAYNSIEGLVEAIGIKRENLCMACLTAEYPLQDKQLNLAENLN